MRGHKNPGTLEAEIRMLRTQRDWAVLVVEGPDDWRFWSRRTGEQCELVDGEGKPNVIGCVRRADKAALRGVVGAVDSDYDQLMGVAWGSMNLVGTDAHDLECVLCRSSALEAVLAEYGEERAIREFEGREGGSVRCSLLHRALAFGRIRWAALRCELEVDSNALDKVARFVREDDWTVDERDLVRVVAGGGSGDGERRLTECLDELPVDADPWHVVRGHDLIVLLRIGLRRALGSMSPTRGTQDIARALRLAFSPDQLRASSLYRDLRAWERRNPPYRVLFDSSS